MACFLLFSFIRRPLFVNGFMLSGVPSPPNNMAMASSKYKATIAPDTVNPRSSCRQLQVPVHLARDISFALRFCELHKFLLSPTTMPALNVFLKVAEIAKASGLPYLKNVAKVTVVIFKLLEQKGKNKEDAKELCESIANTIIIIDTLVHKQGEQGAPYFMGICREMEGYLQGMVQGLKDTKRKHSGIKGIFCVDEYRDTIQAYRKHVNDLKMDFLIHVMGDCLLGVMQMNCLLKDVMAQVVVHHSEEDVVIRIPKTTAAISAFFLTPRGAA
ncbi:hypothetical protein ARMGADRAFT_1037173 [Armillaria gallica]|uniref:Uncharacterized protein n=1 Tax=Armillaria gallica TaxID=47427 RepID=A0A2H3CSP4_ARMGA|nr:hypothetical protein ARMGADRAFT_1037173 [Armillaria gallica]